MNGRPYTFTFALWDTLCGSYMRMLLEFPSFRIKFVKLHCHPIMCAFMMTMRRGYNAPSVYGSCAAKTREDRKLGGTGSLRAVARNNIKHRKIKLVIVWYNIIYYNNVRGCSVLFCVVSHVSASWFLCLFGWLWSITSSFATDLNANTTHR